jgi:predicted GNAT family acetyltransferase
MTATPLTVVDHPAAGRYELVVDGQVAFAAYRKFDGAVVFTHTEVPPALEGRGVGSALARGALDLAIADRQDIVPLCPFIAAWIARHPEYAAHVRKPAPPAG